MLYGIPAPRPRISSKFSAKSEQKNQVAQEERGKKPPRPLALTKMLQ